MQSVCEDAGLPMEPTKSVGPATSLVFLGIELDSVRGELCLPLEKLSHLQDQIAQSRGRKACRKWELLSFIGPLSCLHKVVQAGRTFLHWLIDLSTKATHLNHFIHLNADARADIEWWYHFLGLWNGVSLLSALSKEPPATTIYSDVSGHWGCGAICGHNWFQQKWDERSEPHHISIKELTPIVIVIAIWGHHFKGRTLLARSDNPVAIAAINSQSSPVKEMAHLLRCLAFIAALYQLRVMATHISGNQNLMADALSRNRLSTFLFLHPQAAKLLSAVPATLSDLLIPQSPNWNLQHWTVLWNTIFQLD